MTTLQTKGDYKERILANVDNCLTETDLGKGEKYRGKVRDRYDLGDCLAMVTTDRQSAFDRVLAAIPFKGQALNLTSRWWFDKTSDIVANHVVAQLAPRSLLATKCRVVPVEVVVRDALQKAGYTVTTLQVQGEWDEDKPKYSGGKWNSDRLPHEEIAR